MSKFLSYVLMIVITTLLVGGIFVLALPTLRERLEPQLLSYMAARLTDAEREAIYGQIAASFGSAWDVSPEPDVARLAKRNWKGTINQAPVQTNNAGLRSSTSFGKKPPGVFRIVCLGDSFVFGGGGLEEDRFCDQLGAFYREEGITVDGRAIEAYALGLGSWTLIQEATYLGRRISDYEPDVILMLSVANDITESSAVTGAGVVTRDYSPQSRQWGSGIFHNTVNEAFGGRGYAALQWDLSPASREIWVRSMEALGRLVALQRERGGEILLSTLNALNRDRGHSIAFPELFRRHVKDSGIEAPTLDVTYLKFDRANRLPHDGHPSRKGHRLLVDQYVTALDALGWVTVPDSALPDLDPRIPVLLNPEPNPEALSEFRQQFVSEFLHTDLDFSHLAADDSNAFLGGIFPESKEVALSAPPWASLRAGFLLALPEDRRPAGIELVLKVPDRPELFPFHLEASLDGRRAATFDWSTPLEGGVYRVELPAFDPIAPDVVEVVLRTDSYFAEIGDARMKSYHLVSARVR